MSAKISRSVSESEGTRLKHSSAILKNCLLLQLIRITFSLDDPIIELEATVRAGTPLYGVQSHKHHVI